MMSGGSVSLLHASSSNLAVAPPTSASPTPQGETLVSPIQPCASWSSAATSRRPFSLVPIGRSQLNFSASSAPPASVTRSSASPNRTKATPAPNLTATPPCPPPAWIQYAPSYVPSARQSRLRAQDLSRSRFTNPFFLGCQFHPEFKSKPLEPRPIFRDFISAHY
jgi:hypothetical protein